MEKTRDLFKKSRHTKGTFHGKMGTIKDRNCMDLIEAEDIKKRWQEYTEELYTKEDLHDPDNHDGVITHIEPDVTNHSPRLQTLPGMRSQVGFRKHHYKASGADGTPVELFQILKDIALKHLKCCCI